MINTSGLKQTKRPKASPSGLQQNMDSNLKNTMTEKNTDSIWVKIPRQRKMRVVWVLWFITWLGLLAGLYNRMFYEWVLVFSALHTVLFLILLKFNLKAFPVQVRIAYFIWVAIGTFAPYMIVLMYITTIGLFTNLFLNYCPLARMMYLMPWNRKEPLSVVLIVRVFLTPPVEGQFKPVKPA